MHRNSFLQVPDFRKGYGDFINKLMTFHYIPLSTIGKKDFLNDLKLKGFL
jgi:hypothetical protein